jgi:predicted RNA-binding protein with RPS1 domain
VVPFGVFVEIPVDGQKLEGLVHISEISWEKVDSVGKSVKEGDEVEVQVIGTDEENGKLALSMKRLRDDPWKEMASKYPVESKHKGKVVKVMPYGVFVNLDKGIEGLIHASKMPADMSFKEGDEVDVFVESVDLDKRRLSLGVVLMAKPVGYKYNQQLGVEFGGKEPSKGQRQKLSIAKILYRNSPVMILDEPTASVDAESEAKIFDTIENLSKDQTAVLISHDFSTISQCDKIFVMEKGSVVEEGNHKELMKNKGLYSELYKLQADRFKK